MHAPEAPEAPHRRIAAALLYAMEKHANQRRRDGSPYIAHPIRVAESLRSIGRIVDHEVVMAAYMHDLIEDTDCEYDDLRKRFGKRVADLVAVLSGDMRLPKPERRAEVIERARTAPPEAQAIRLADRLDNLLDMSGFSLARKQEYVDGSRRTLDACRGANAALEAALAAAIERIEHELASGGGMSQG
ncbi:MAG TPA: HD domain-containing protein [Planctomycetota bacterium]|nr:HD domain-containing protein [Planctomycetota bacterium]